MTSTTTKDRRLGKGLAALLGTPMDDEGNPLPESNSNIQTLELPVEQIENNPFQPRREFNHDEIASLAESIKNHQQLQPVLVRIVDGKYQLISGERRLRATIHAGLQTIRAEVREADDRLVAELAIIENLQRKDLESDRKSDVVQTLHRRAQVQARRLGASLEYRSKHDRQPDAAAGIAGTDSGMVDRRRTDCRSRSRIAADRRRRNPDQRGQEDHGRKLERAGDRVARG